MFQEWNSLEATAQKLRAEIDKDQASLTGLNNTLADSKADMAQFTKRHQSNRECCIRCG